MGNMSNPTVNRWGSNSIWYHFWYADTIYAKQVNQDKIFSQLIDVYLIYGLESHYHHFNNAYWFRKPQNKQYTTWSKFIFEASKQRQKTLRQHEIFKK